MGMLQVSIEEPYNLASVSASLPGDASTLDRVRKVVRHSQAIERRAIKCRLVSELCHPCSWRRRGSGLVWTPETAASWDSIQVISLRWRQQMPQQL
jgi:hypothetical protein